MNSTTCDFYSGISLKLIFFDYFQGVDKDSSAFYSALRRKKD